MQRELCDKLSNVSLLSNLFLYKSQLLPRPLLLYDLLPELFPVQRELCYKPSNVSLLSNLFLYKSELLLRLLPLYVLLPGQYQLSLLHDKPNNI